MSASRTPVLVRPGQPRPRNPGEDIFHVCLAGLGTSDDWELIASLKQRYQVTVVERFPMLNENRILDRASVLLLGCETQLRRETVLHLKSTHPALEILLVNGNLTASDLTGFFRAGATDYFPSEVDPHLIVERVQHICRRAGGRPRAAETTPR